MDRIFIYFLESFFITKVKNYFSCSVLVLLVLVQYYFSISLPAPEALTSRILEDTTQGSLRNEHFAWSKICILNQPKLDICTTSPRDLRKS